MAPCSRLEEKLNKLGLSTDDGGCNRSSPASKTKYQFQIFFPMPPYDGLQFNALRSGTGFNFTGQLLGVGGKQLQRIKQESGARLEVNNAEGNLNGSHPDPLDPNLHALVSADSLSKLHKAAMMVWELLAPVNGKFIPIEVVPGGSVRLTVAQPGKAAAACAKAVPQQKQGGKATKTKPAATNSSSSSTSSSSNHSSSPPESSAESRPVSASPLLTPVTPAAAAGQRPSRSSIYVTPDSCCSYQDVHGEGSERNRSGNSSNNGFCNLDSFMLPPAAVGESAASSLAAHNGTEVLQEQQQQVLSKAAWSSSGLQEDQLLLEPATPGSGSACSTEAASTQLSSQCHEPQQQQQQQGQFPAAIQPMNSSSQESMLLHTSAGNVAITACPTHAVPAAPSETAFAGDAGAKAAEACLLAPAAVLQKPGWHLQDLQHQQHQDSSTAGLISSADSNPSSCFHYGLGLSSTSLDSSSSCCAKDSPALQALIVDHQRQQQHQQMVEQQMQLMQMMQMQQQALVGSFGSSQSTFESSTSLFGGPSPLLGPRAGSFVGSFEGDGLQLGPNALLHIAGSSQQQQQQQMGLPGVQVRPAGLAGTFGLAGAPPGCHVSGSLAGSVGMPESPCFHSSSQAFGAMQLHEQQQQLLAASELEFGAARDGLVSNSSFEGLAVHSSGTGLHYSGPAGIHAGSSINVSVLGGLHLPGSCASCWTAGPHELAAAAFEHSTMSKGSGTPDLALALQAGADAAFSRGASLKTPGRQGKDGTPPGWLHAQHGAEQQQQEMMSAHAAQQGCSMQQQHQQQLVVPASVYACLDQPGSASIW